RNNFLKRAVTWNPDGLLNNARHITLGGHYAYVATPKGMVILDLDNPLKPKHIKTIALDDVRGSAVQFRYLFVTDRSGLRVVDITKPKEPILLPAQIPLANAQKLYLARTYAYVAAAEQGLAIIDIEKPESPVVYQMYSADGKLNDARDVVVGTTNASLFAYVADGKNGLKVVQLTAPDTQPRFYGFSPDPKPNLIAWRNTQSAALAVSKGLDRDRAVDETGHQIAVFGRIGSRPFNRSEMDKLYMRPDGNIWTVSDKPNDKDMIPKKSAKPAPSQEQIR
ncbi:MAG: LVIVD repeat-containing protein, partial [Methylophilaceae bacterium]